ncbi:DUF4234 domain-containing protein [Spirosoma aerolatum]|uniref:DUF4234 domain-containing protein n=1 Tax=Spirosoma aerolatum TaxID=1211326 RepID=UPI0009AE6677|nr:DUF4234 domain-containing protein [Spirosoma aerolatum]
MENNYNDVETVPYMKSQPVWAFCLLSFFTFGIYTIYWFYKNWAFFRDVYNWDIYPFWRAIFNIFFVHTLLEHINDVAVEKGHPGISSNGYATGFVILAVAQRMLDRVSPDSLALMALFVPPFLFLVPSVKQLNYIYRQAYPNKYNPALSPGEFLIVIVGGIVMVLAVAGLLMGEEPS